MKKDPVRILVADDHEIVRRGVSSLLESRDDFEVCAEATNGEDAIKQAQQLKPDLIVLDVTMPGMDGLTAAKLIKKRQPGIPILILSMHGGSEIIRAAQLAGVQAFITKSDAAKVLLEAVDAVLQGETFFSSGVR
jgi:DNA-binding NarL/FixJ family response regulator